MKPYNRISIKSTKPDIKGKIIFFDGPDGSGKSTQIKIIKKYLEDKGYNVIQTRLPGMPGEHGDNIRKALFGKDRYMNFWATRTLFAAEHLEFMERYGYREDCVVLCDRYVPISNTCIGGAEIGNIKEIANNLSHIYNLADRKPDAVIIFSVTPETVANRLRERISKNDNVNYIDLMSQEFHKRSCNYYDSMETLGDNNPKILGLSETRKTVYTIDANDEVNYVSELVEKLLHELFNLCVIC